MKPITQEISNWFNNETIQVQLRSFESTSKDYSEYETSVSEVISDLNYCQQIIQENINVNSFDNLTFHKRNQIVTLLRNITNHLIQLQRFNFNASHPSSKPQANAVISAILQLKDMVDSSILTQQLKGVFDYIEQTKELIKIKRRFTKLVKDIESVETIKVKTSKRLEDLDLRTNEILSLLDNLKTDSKYFDNLKSEVELLKKEITDTRNDTENKRITINAIHNSAKDLEKIITESDSKITNLKKKQDDRLIGYFASKTEEIEESTKNLNQETKGIVSTNKSLLKEVQKLLQGANAGRLYKAFWLRKMQLEKELVLWLRGIIAINTILVLIPFIVFIGVDLSFVKIHPLGNSFSFFGLLLFLIPIIALEWFGVQSLRKKGKFEEIASKIENKKETRVRNSFIFFNLILIGLVTLLIMGLDLSELVFAGNNKIDLDGIFIMKLLITLPLIILDWFIISQYNYKKALVEEYSFKAALSVSLPHYKDLINEEKGNARTEEFIVDTVNKIYASPFNEKKLKKKEIELLHSLTEKGIEGLGKITNS